MTVPEARVTGWWLSAALAVGAYGCAEPLSPATQVVVLVGGPRDVDALDLSVLSGNARNLVESRHVELTARADDAAGLPTSFVIVPGDLGHPEAVDFRIVVTGRTTRDGVSVATSRSAAIARFSAGLTTLLPVVLSTGCGDPLCGCAADEDSCAVVCLPDVIAPYAGCNSVPTYGRLAEVRAGHELEELAHGAGGCKGGEVLSPQNTCTDLDECAFGLHDCDVSPFACENEVSGDYAYACRCPPGTRGDGVGELGCQDKP